MPSKPDNKETSEDVEIFQGLLFQRVFKKRAGGQLAVVIDVDEGNQFTAAAVIRQQNTYILTELPGGLTAENIGKRVGSISLPQLIEATKLGIQNGLPIGESFVQTLQQAASKGSRLIPKVG